MVKQDSPCLQCTRVLNPADCDNKHCAAWKKWFIQNWESIHRYPRRHMEQATLKPMGVPLGGRFYAHPHRVRAYRETNPCESCCAKAVCSAPCKVYTIWKNEGGRT